jgi:hypothetical protein
MERLAKQIELAESQVKKLNKQFEETQKKIMGISAPANMAKSAFKGFSNVINRVEDSLKNAATVRINANAGLDVDTEKLNIFKNLNIDAESLPALEQGISDIFGKIENPLGFLDGIKDDIASYTESLPALGQGISEMIGSSMGGMTQAFAELAASGKLNFKDLADSVIKDLTRMAMQQMIMKSLFGGMGGGIGGIGGLFGIAHTGGIAGQLTGMKKEVSPLVFANAPRFHGGGVLGAEEYPIIAKRGEGIFTPEQMRALSPAHPQVNVNVRNNTSAQVTLKQHYNGNGGVDINARIEDAMSAAAANRSSKFNQALNSSRRLARR